VLETVPIARLADELELQAGDSFHRTLATVFASMDADFLLSACCFFGGGTQIALMLEEFRESRDIDFLCSDRAGFRRLREAISEHSLGPILRQPIALAREVRADRDGIRTFLAVGDTRIKFEIVLEARLDLTGSIQAAFGLPALDP